MKELKIILVYLDEELGIAWKNNFSKEKNISIEQGDITLFNVDAIVSPANSFGFMDGGLDYYLSLRFGWDVQQRLQKYIGELELKELLIGQSHIIETKDEKVPYIISAPTMRVPMSFHIATSVNAYLAMKAALISAVNHPNINAIAIPGLCTGCGKMPFDVAAKQMYQAYKEIILREHPSRSSFAEIQKEQIFLNPNSMIWD